MSLNKHNETELCRIKNKSGKEYFITRDLAGRYVLREESYDGKELFSPIKDNGRKNTRKERVSDVHLLEDVIFDSKQ